MLAPVAESARKALSLDKDAVCRLFVVMMVLLGWLAGMGAVAMTSLQNLYGAWQLAQKSTLSLYLLPDTPSPEVEALQRRLSDLPGVSGVSVLDQTATLALLKPYLGGDSALPLPKILDVTVSPQLDRARFDEEVKSRFPMAEIDDARDMLGTVSDGVRLAQAVALGLAAGLFLVLAALVALTVRAGLRAKQEALSILQYIGATDGFLTDLVCRQVLVRAGVGTAGALFLVVFSVMALRLGWPTTAPYLDSAWVWAAGVATPLALLAVAVLAARLSARQVIQGA